MALVAIQKKCDSKCKGCGMSLWTLKNRANQAIKENCNESLSFNYWVGSSVIREVKSEPQSCYVS